MAMSQDNQCADALAVKFIGQAKDYGLCYGFMGEKCAFNFLGVYFLAAAVDPVINTPRDIKKPITVKVSKVTGMIPIAYNGWVAFLGLGLKPWVYEATSCHDLSLNIFRYFLAVFTKDPNVPRGHNFSNCV